MSSTDGNRCLSLLLEGGRYYALDFPTCFFHGFVSVWLALRIGHGVSLLFLAFQDMAISYTLAKRSSLGTAFIFTIACSLTQPHHTYPAQ